MPTTGPQIKETNLHCYMLQIWGGPVRYLMKLTAGLAMFSPSYINP